MTPSYALRILRGAVVGTCLFTGLSYAQTSSEPQVEKLLNANEWRSIQQQILASGTFLSADEEKKLQEEQNPRIPEHTVLSGTLGLTDYIKPFNTDAGDLFGFSVALSGNVLVVGAREEDSNGLGDDGSPFSNNLVNSGAAYVFRRGLGGWQQEAYIKSPNPDSSDFFGTDVAVEGNILVIGAEEEDSFTAGINGESNNLGTNVGAAYVYERVDGVWELVAFLKADNPDTNDFFGHEVAISNRTIVVGSLFEDTSIGGVNPAPNNSNVNTGAAYVFREVDGVWEQEAFLKASNPERSDHFGESVAISGDTIVVGATLEDSPASQVNGSQGNGGTNVGAAYVYERNNGVWAQQAYLKPTNPDVSDHFGTSVSISGDIVVVASQFEDGGNPNVDSNPFDNSVRSAGAAYVFDRDSNGDWDFRTYLKSPNPEIDDQFGFSVSVSGDFIVVGEFGEDSVSIGPDGVGDNSVPDAGAAYVYQIVNDDVELVSVLKSLVPGTGDMFGFNVAVSGTTIAAGAQLEDSVTNEVNGDANNNDAEDSGGVFLYESISTFHPISGVVTGLAEGNQVTLLSNGEDVMTLSENGEFRFPGLFVEGETYEVVIAENGFPVNPRQDCSVINGSGVLDVNTVGSIVVECTLRTISINRNLNTVNQAVVFVPVQLAPEGVSLSGVEFSLDYDATCLNPDADGDGVIDNIIFNVNSDFTTSVSFDPTQSDAEIDVVIADLSLPFSALNTGDVASIGFTVDCPESQNSPLHNTTIAFSATNPPSFSNLAGDDVEGTFEDGNARVWAGITGDCNASGDTQLTVSDLSRLVLEIADGDGTNFIDAPESDNFGSPQGCDANGNEVINVADLTCLTRLLGNDACEAIRVNTVALPELNLGTQTENDVLWMQARMEQKGNAVGGVSYSLDLNGFALNTRAVDFDNNGIPDRIRFNQDLQTPPNVLWREKEQRLDIFIANVDANNGGGANAVQALPEGLLVEVGVPVSNTQLDAFETSETFPAVFSDIGGMEVQGVLSVGDIIFKDTFE